jgi:hypothetical protein
MTPFYGVFVSSDGTLKGLEQVLGGGGALSVPDDQIFSDASSRDAFFTANPDLLVDGAYCIVGDELQKYTDGVWIDHTVIIRGPKGDQGIQGSIGQTGLQGIQGEQGLPGETGGQGVQGTTGLQGIQGEVGPKGEQGEPGAQGIPGIQGAQGPQGAASISSINYLGMWVAGTYVDNDCTISPKDGHSYVCIAVSTTEEPGSDAVDWRLLVMQGPQGLQGVQGQQGIQGEAGPAGAQGLQGIQGLQGEQGLQGPQGEVGQTGPQGIQGPQGNVGETGTAGEQGIQGETGAVGAVTAFGIILTVADWNGNAITVTNVEITESRNGLIIASQDSTSEEFAAFDAAKLHITTQGDGSLTITAFGTAPTINIPIAVMLL